MAAEGSGLGIQLINTLFSIDDEFVEFRLSGELPPETIAKWEALATGATDIGGYADIVATLEDLDVKDSVEASTIAVTAFLAWEGALATERVDEPASHGAWQTIGVPVVRTLRRAGALWAAKELSTSIIDYLSSTWEFLRQNEATWHMLEAVEVELAQIENELSDRLTETAMQLHERMDDGPTRATIAALFWAMGDVPRAEALRREYRPSFRQIRRLVTNSFHRVPVDPLVQQVWITLEEHCGQFTGMHYWLWTHYHDVDVVDDVARLYALAFLESCDVGVVSGAINELFATSAFHGGTLRQASPSTWLRVVSFLKMTSPQVGGMGSWPERVASAADVVRMDSSLAADRDEYDASPGNACHYLTGDLVDIINSIEVYRGGILWYWRQLHPMHDEDDGQRERLLRLVTGARFAQTALRLPRARLRFQAEEGGSAEFPRLVQQAASIANIADLTAELSALATHNPAQVTADHPATVAAFARALTVNR